MSTQHCVTAQYFVIKIFKVKARHACANVNAALEEDSNVIIIRPLGAPSGIPVNNPDVLYGIL